MLGRGGEGRGGGEGSSSPVSMYRLCVTPPPFLASQGLRVLFPAPSGLLLTAVCVVLHCDSCSLSEYLLSACCVLKQGARHWAQQ